MNSSAADPLDHLVIKKWGLASHLNLDLGPVPFDLQTQLIGTLLDALRTSLRDNLKDSLRLDLGDPNES